jgi:uncharacterized protein (DUF58 family)
MRPIPLIPTRRLVLAFAALAAAAAVARLAGAAAGPVALAGWAGAAALVLAFAVDVAVALARLRRHPVTVSRTLPHAFAIGVPHPVGLVLANEGPTAWRVSVYDHVPATFRADALPLALLLPATHTLQAAYDVVPMRRGRAAFEPAALRLRTPLALAEIARRAGPAETRQVYPNFAAVSRYAWLAGDRRLAEIGIKSYRARGSGTDFKQLADYVPGSPTRHIDWSATMRHHKPVVREFQDDRDQAVMFLLDCGRRMRADDRETDPALGRTSHVAASMTDAAGGPGDGSHFDHALNALMLMAYVALKDGDAVGALTFGTPQGGQRHAPPAKGIVALNALVARLHDIEPSPTHSDYLAAAREMMLRQPRRALVVVLTNFRDEDSPELAAALKLMRTRHLVLLASLRERRIGELMEQPLTGPESIATTATAHLSEQSRRDAFHRLAQRDALQIDVEPQQLAAALVNRYHAVKRARLL